jgi:prepilin peptidase CpaA
VEKSLVVSTWGGRNRLPREAQRGGVVGSHAREIQPSSGRARGKVPYELLGPRGFLFCPTPPCRGFVEGGLDAGGALSQLETGRRLPASAAWSERKTDNAMDKVLWLMGLSLVVGVAASIEDLWHRKVSNAIALGAFASGLVVQARFGGLAGFWDALLGSVIGFAVFLIFFLMGGMGGGDVKLMAGFGAILGSKLIVVAALMTAIVGGLMALVYLIVKKLRRGAAPAGAAALPLRKEAIPYAPAITLGVLLSFLSDPSFAFLSNKSF